ncbi:MAG TPA: protein kinase, partial [Polyangiaceae bacterium]
GMSTAQRAVEHGAFDYLTKPLDPERFETSIARAVVAHRAAVAKRHALDSGVRAKAIRSGGRSLEGREQLAPGEILAGRYRILGTLGAGGMGTVYAAERQDLARMPVALKVLHPELAKRKDATLRFRREAEVVASLHHPNIVNVLDFESIEDDVTFLVMELLRGDTLSAAIAHDPPFSAERASFIVAQVLSALAAAHATRIVHRDLKPDNVYLTTMSNIGDLVKVLDFGIAKLQTEPIDTKLTQTGTILGTPAYMAPEYARGEAAGVLGDIYAVGCVLYEMLAKEPPFTGANYNALIFAILDKAPKPLAELRPDLPPELVAIVETAMAKDPKDRFQSADAMQEALTPWLPPPSIPSMRPIDSRRIENAPTEVALPSTPPSARK